jgi:6-pyruvoyltetrahydropterin/6-carboxytetrahydropterin synthase
MLIFKEFHFDAAHFLPNAPIGHKCREMHGHTYRLRIAVKGQPQPDSGWLLDFTDLKHAVTPVIELLDHHCLNNVPGLENPTCELLAIWIWDKLLPAMPNLARIELYETISSGVIYEGS